MNNDDTMVTSATVTFNFAKPVTQGTADKIIRNIIENKTPINPLSESKQEEKRDRLMIGTEYGTCACTPSLPIPLPITSTGTRYTDPLTIEFPSSMADDVQIELGELRDLGERARFIAFPLDMHFDNEAVQVQSDSLGLYSCTKDYTYETLSKDTPYVIGDHNYALGVFKPFPDPKPWHKIYTEAIEAMGKSALQNNKIKDFY